MVSGWWDRQVRVMIGSSTTHNVTRPSHAAELLLNGGPEQDGPAYRKAKEAVLEAMENPRSDSLMIASRLAFEEAAREAGILVSPRIHGLDALIRRS